MATEVKRFEIPVTVRQPGENSQNLLVPAALVPAHEASLVADTIAMGGLGFNGSMPALAAERSAEHEGGRGILYVGSPSYQKVGNAPRNDFPARLERFGAQHVNGVYDWALEEGMIDKQATSIFESQQAEAGVQAMLAAESLPADERMRGAVMFLRAMGGVVLKHRPKLIGGLAASAPEVMFDRATGPTTLHATRQFLADFSRYQGKMSKYVIKANIWPDLLKVYDHEPVRAIQTIVGSHDRLLPKEKQYAAAAAVQGSPDGVLTRNMYEIEGGHVSPASVAGAKQMVQVAQHARSGGSELTPYRR